MYVILSKNGIGMEKTNPRFIKAAEIFKEHGGILRTSEALNAGIHPDTLYVMRDFEILEVVSRGVFRLADGTPLSNPDLVPIAKRLPEAVICLISALSFHDITTQIPHEVHIALKRGAEKPRLEFPPLKTYRFSGGSFTEGIENHEIDGVSMRIYTPEKTIADCFKFRNRIGLDVAIEAIRFYRERRKLKVNDLMRFADICRVKKIITPYLEAIL